MHDSPFAKRRVISEAEGDVKDAPATDVEAIRTTATTETTPIALSDYGTGGAGDLNAKRRRLENPTVDGAEHVEGSNESGGDLFSPDMKREGNLEQFSVCTGASISDHHQTSSNFNDTTPSQSSVASPSANTETQSKILRLTETKMEVEWSNTTSHGRNTTGDATYSANSFMPDFDIGNNADN